MEIRHPYVLCENAMSVVKVTAMFSGFLDWADANEWVVTRKLGRIIARKVDDARRSKSRAVAFVATRLAETRAAKDEDAAKPDGEKKKKTYGKECAMGFFFVACAAYGALAHAMWQYAVFLTAQGLVFLAFGLNYVDGK